MTEVLPSIADLPPEQRGQLHESFVIQSTELIHGSAYVHGAREEVPYTIEVPESPNSEAVALLIPGYGAIKRQQRKLRHALAAEQGITSITYDPARLRNEDATSWSERLLDPQKLHQDTVEGIITDVGYNINVYRSAKSDLLQNAKYALVPHSMGEEPAVNFALENRASVDSLVRIETVGTEGRLGLKLGKRGAEELLFDILPAVLTGKFGANPHLAARELKYFLHDPLRSLGEAISCMRADTISKTAHLRALGVYMAYVGGTRDRFFKPEATNEAVGHMLNFSTELDMGHVGPQIQASLVAEAVGPIIAYHPSN